MGKLSRETPPPREGEPMGARMLTDTLEKEHISAEKAKKKGRKATIAKTLFPRRTCATRPKILGQKVIKASSHQGQALFQQALFQLSSRGKQYTAMAAAAVVNAANKNIEEWERDDLDIILLNGDRLYGQIVDQRPDTEEGYLLISDIPDQVNMFDSTFMFRRTEPVHGLISLRQSTEVAFTLTDAVSKIFGQTSATILILKDMSAMIYQSRHNERCFLFDSHSRNNKGMPTHNGKSILMTSEDSSDLVSYCHEFVSKLDAEELVHFEIVGIEAVPVVQGVLFDNDSSTLIANHAEINVQEVVSMTDMDVQEAVPMTDIQEAVPTPDINVQGAVPTPDINVQGAVPTPDINIQGAVPTPDINIQGAVPIPDIDVQGAVPRPDINVQGAVPIPDINIQGAVPRPAINVKGTVLL